MNLKYATIREYIESNYYKSLSIPILKCMGDLEKSIAGYIALSPSAPKVESEKGISYEELRQVVFEYYKIHNPSIIKQFLEDNLTELKMYRGTWSEGNAERWIKHFQKVVKQDADEIEYQDFNPERFHSAISRLQSKTPFFIYCNNILKNLEILGVINHLQQGSKKITINPNLKFSKTKK